MLTYFSNVLKNLRKIVQLLKAINEKHDEILNRLERIEESLKIK